MSQQSQRKLVLQRLLEKKTITSWEAITDFRCTRLSAVIFDLRKEGYNIDTKRMVNENNGKNFAEYRLISKDLLHPLDGVHYAK